jgi:hypothetical protein
VATIAICQGIIDNRNDRAICDTGWEVAAHVAPFNITDVDPVVFVTYLGSGFFLMLPLWAATIGLRTLIHAVKG